MITEHGRRLIIFITEFYQRVICKELVTTLSPNNRSKLAQSYRQYDKEIKALIEQSHFDLAA